MLYTEESAPVVEDEERIGQLTVIHEGPDEMQESDTSSVMYQASYNDNASLMSKNTIINR